MRRISLKNIILLALLTASLLSCGSDNENGGLPDPTDGNSPITNETSGATDGSKTFESFTGEVEKGNFVSLQDYLKQTLGSNASENFNGAIYYRKYEQLSDDSSFWDGLKSAFSFDYCTSYEECQEQQTSNLGMRKIDSDDSIERSSNFSMDSELGNTLVKVKSNLVDRMKNADNVKKCISGNFGNLVCYDYQTIVENKDNNNFYLNTSAQYEAKAKRFVFDYDNYRYVVDLNYPLAANPVAVLDTSSGVSFSL